MKVPPGILARHIFSGSLIAPIDHFAVMERHAAMELSRVRIEDHG